MARSIPERPPDSSGVAATGSRGFMAAFDSLHIHDFRYMWYGQVSSAAAMHADLLARSWLTWQLTGSSLAVVLVNLMRSIPMLTLGIFAGVIADRFDKKKILFMIQAWTIGVYIAIATVVLLDIVELWHVYAYSLLIGFGFAMNQPVRMSFIPRLVGREKLLNALSLSSIAINSTRLGGPAIIGFLIAFTGMGTAFIISAVMYAIALWTTTRIRTSGAPSGDRKEGGSVISDLFEGFRYLGENRLILVLVIVALGPLSFGHSWTMLLPQFVDEVLDAESGMLGIITSVAASRASIPEADSSATSRCRRGRSRASASGETTGATSTLRRPATTTTRRFADASSAPALQWPACPHRSRASDLAPSPTRRRGRPRQQPLWGTAKE